MQTQLLESEPQLDEVAALRAAGRTSAIDDLDWSAEAPITANGDPERTGRKAWWSWSGGVRKHDLLMFTSQMAIMCKSGVDLAEALREATRSCSHPALRPVLQHVYNDVSSGASVSASMHPYAHVFGEAYVGSIAAAESSGKVPEVLDRLTKLLRNQIRLRSSLIATISYPVALIGISSLVILALVFFVLPQFGKVFANMDKTPPPFTQLLLDVASIARANVLIIVGAAIVAIAAILQASRTPSARRLWDNGVLNSTITRSAFRSLFTGRTFRLLGTLIESGVPLLDSVRLCRSTISNQLFHDLFRNMERDILNGTGITNTIAQASFLPIGVSQMVSTAERTGRLGKVLDMIGSFYEEDGERQIRQLVKLLEPLIIMLMGVFVACVVASVMLPLLNVSTMTR